MLNPFNLNFYIQKEFINFELKNCIHKICSVELVWNVIVLLTLIYTQYQ